LIDHSHTSQIFHFTIHITCHITSAISIAALISFGNFGIFGAGGNRGNSIFTLGKNDGISGKSGGDGITGIDGKVIHRFILSSFASNSHIIFIHRSNESFRLKEKSISGGFGMFGKLGNATVVGTKLNFGNLISVAKFICDRSI
jgi:hypothetical protein